MKTYYDILDIDVNASPKEIKDSFRKLAKKHHPDANGNSKDAEEKFKGVNEAYNTLINEDERAEYDFFLKAVGEYKRHYYSEEDEKKEAKTKPRNDNSGYDDDEDEDLDIEMTIRVTAEEAKKGCYRNIKVDELEKEYQVHVPSNTKNRDKIKLKGQGYKSVKGNKYGDIIIKVIVAKIYEPAKTDNNDEAKRERRRKAYEERKNYYDNLEEEDSSESMIGKIGLIIIGVLIIILLIGYICDHIAESYNGRKEINNTLKNDVYQNETDYIYDSYINSKTNNNAKTKPKTETKTEVKTTYVDPNPYKNYTGGYASNKNGVYNYIKILPSDSSVLYATPNEVLNFYLVGYNPSVSINGQATIYNPNGSYGATYYGEQINSYDGTIRKGISFYFLYTGTYKVDVAMSDGLGGWTGKTYTVVVGSSNYNYNNSSVYRDIYRDIYRY